MEPTQPPAAQPPHQQAPGQSPPAGVPVLASWGRRFAAYLIDNLLILLLVTPGIVLAVIGGVAEPDNDALIGLGAIWMLLGFLAAPVYFTVAHGRESGQTLGKKWLGIRVVDDRSGGPIGYGRAFGRWLVPFALSFVCGLLNLLEGLWPLWDRLNQTWHDKIANSVVVKLPDR